VEHERAVAIFDLIEENSFKPVGDAGGPYKLVLSVVDSKLVFDISVKAITMPFVLPRQARLKRLIWVGAGFTTKVRKR